MAFRPNFEDTARAIGDTVTLVGNTDGNPPPDHIQVFLEQGGHVESAGVKRLAPSWRADLPSEGFQPGPATAFGVETRLKPFEAFTWTQTVTIA